jgi:hypothetical protein
MSGKNNVNPDHYKVAGRDRPGEDVVHERQKQSLAQEQARLARRKRPGARPTRAPASRGKDDQDGGREEG